MNFKVELKFKLTKQCVLVAASVENAGANSNNIIFTINDSKVYVLAVTLSPKDYLKLSKILSKKFEVSVYWNEYKTKHENKNTPNEWR